MPSSYMLINRYLVADGFQSQIQKLAIEIAKNNESSFYFSIEQDELIEFKGFSSLNALTNYENILEKVFIEFKDCIKADIKRELLKYVESPIKSQTEIPLTEYIQLRHVEVPPSVYEAYLKWRDETIFNVVRENKSTITSFDAYHSLISGTPGVMFIASFAGEVNKYLKPFTDDNYKNIVKQAADSYITGDNEGLYTKIYKKID
ncbi:hypothetical protein RHO12_11610 [Orbus sturtevantii]|uniref:hypothetical protein n=1 Tax=Orbus sturtevantii TaxID=3074109 RepID=UPI00370DB12C